MTDDSGSAAAAARLAQGGAAATTGANSGTAADAGSTAGASVGAGVGADAGAATGLARTLNTWDLVLLGIGTVIGSGIFLVPAGVLQQADGKLGLALAVWVVAGVLSVLGALTYAEMGAMKPEAGGLYVYIRDAFGPFVAFLYGWGLFFVICSGSVATLAVAFTNYLKEFVDLGDLGSRLAAAAMIAVIAIINVRGTRTSASVQNWTTAAKVLAILALSVALLATGHGLQIPSGQWWPETLDARLLSNIGIAMVGVLWAYEGWQYVTFSAGETASPQKTFPRALFLGTAAIVGIYLLANLGYVAALTPGGAAKATRIAAEAGNSALGPWVGKAIALAILTSMFSAANGLTLTGPRVYFAMARHGLFFRQLAVIHPRFRTPAFAIVTSSIWAAVLAVTGTFETLLTYVVFAGWIFYALGGAAIFYYRRAHPDAPRPFRTPGYPLTPVLFVASAAAIVLNTLATQPGRALVGLAILLAGTPAYLLWRRSAAAVSALLVAK
jgi:APA family basic amino acid/polyamine antiporter